jgi:hypothetical protein
LLQRRTLHERHLPLRRLNGAAQLFGAPAQIQLLMVSI